MTEPLSMLALAAAAGGLTGKVVEKTWESAERWLAARFGSHASTVRDQAEANAAAFIQLLAERVRGLEDQHEIDADTVEASQRHPQFAALLQDTLLNAAQTDERKKHELLADIVAVRLASGSETTAALAAPLAATAVSRATARQLQLLGLMCVVDEIRPMHLNSEDYFRKWVGRVISPFKDFDFHKIDALHLAALACVTFDPTSERGLTTILNLKGIHLLGKLVDLEGVPGFVELQGNWDEGLAGVQLTSVGSIIGGLVFNQLTGATLELPEWP